MSKFILVTDSIPNLYHGGGGITAYSVVQSFVKKGHQITIICLSDNHYTHNNLTENDYILDLEKSGAKIVILEKKRVGPENFVSLIFPNKHNIFSGYLQQREVEELISMYNPDGVFAYHWNAIASLAKINSVPKLGIVGDPIHLPFIFRKLFISKYSKDFSLLEKLKIFVLENTRILRMKYLMDNLLNSCNLSGAFAFHHANDFISRGGNNCKYYRTPIPDPYENKEIPLSYITSRSKFKIVHIGHLQGIATLSGIEILANQILPHLDRLIGSINYELHLVGGEFDSMPKKLKNKLQHPSVIIRGHINPADDEFKTANVVLVPTPIRLGIRVRILTAFSYGSCIVTHIANKSGIPELVHSNNCMLSSTGQGLANACYELYNNPKFSNEISLNARATFEKYFSINTAGNDIVETMELMVKNK